MHPRDIDTLLRIWRDGIGEGRIVPILGPDSQTGCVDAVTGAPMPAQGRDLILAMTGGVPLSPKLMAEFSRAAMSLEFKKGRKFLERFLAELYARDWTVSPQMRWIAEAKPRYAIDLNRDSVLPKLFAAAPHALIQGVARLSKADPRYRAFRFDGSDLMPGAVGAGSFWKGMVNYSGGQSAKEVADEIQKSWDALK